jgi:hypothetical protein
MIYSFKIYDCHEKQSFAEDGFTSIPFDWWHKFELTILLTDTWITGFREYTLFDDDSNPTECTKVYLSDGTIVFAVNKYETFKKNFTENYLPLFKSIHAPIQHEIAN